jgi:hypothetical protein
MRQVLTPVSHAGSLREGFKRIEQLLDPASAALAGTQPLFLTASY